MSDELLQPEGIVTPPSSLRIPRARVLADAVGVRGLPYVRFVECRQLTLRVGEPAEVVVFDLEVERPQRLANDIRRIERVAATFVPADDGYPEVLALRRDFPRVPHTNLRFTEIPRSLCLYEEPWPQVALRWTAVGFIERIRFWLAETAKGTLHQGDQPLEQLILGSLHTLVLPPDLFDGKNEGEHEELHVRLAAAVQDCRMLIAKRGTGEGGLPLVALSFTARPQMHGVIRHNPRNLADLDAFLNPAGISLLERLREKLPDWNTEDLRDKPLLMVIAFPLTRSGRETVEGNNLWVFATTSSVAEIGVDIGIFERSEYGLGQVVSRDPERNGQSISLDVIAPQFDLTRESAATASGVLADARKTVAIGAGALGSQVIKTLALTGFGRWCVIDEDILLPHNLARHALDRAALGHPKAFAMAAKVRSIFEEKESPKWLETDILRPGEDAERISEELATAELILDMAASIPVSRHLTHSVESPARRVAAFLNPRGTDLVFLAEDAQRTIQLDSLEMQYYRAVVADERLQGHLLPPEERIRYARSCRDVTSVIPNHLVMLHAATAAHAVRQAVDSDDAAIRVWRADPETGEVRHIQIPVATAERNTFGGWTLVLDKQLTTRIAELRTSKLPNETGGVLIGAYDLARKLVYVVDTIPSPPDSEEWPTLYIRGKRGLSSQVEKICGATSGQLEYVGEWHSHPDGCPCRPSDDDLKVFSWLTKNMDDAGLPALMAIAGQGDVTEWYFGHMLRSGGWEVGR